MADKIVKIASKKEEFLESDFVFEGVIKEIIDNGDDLDKLIDRLNNEQKPLRKEFYGTCSNCGSDVVGKYAMGYYYYSCKCGNLDTLC